MEQARLNSAVTSTANRVGKSSRRKGWQSDRDLDCFVCSTSLKNFSLLFILTKNISGTPEDIQACFLKLIEA
jgi:hypothetical protein